MLRPLGIAFLWSTFLVSFSLAAPPTTHPVDADLEPEMAKVVTWLDTGGPDEKEIAENALRMSPPEATPFLKTLAESKKLQPATAALLLSITESLTASREKIRQENLELNLYYEGLSKTYDEVGEHNPTWDDEARRVTRLFFKGGATMSQIVDAAKILVASGCTDPHIRYLQLDDKKAPAPLGERIAVIKALFASKYPADCRLMSLKLLDGALSTADEAQRKDIKSLISQGIDLLKVAQTQKQPHARLTQCITNLAAANTEPGLGKQVDGWLAIAPQLREALPNNDSIEQNEAEIYADAAASLRGTGVASTVPPERWNTILAYLEHSSMAAERGLALSHFGAKYSRIILTNMRNLDPDPQRQLAELHRCLSLNPDSLDTLFVYTWNSLRRWSGDENFDQRINRLAKAAILSRNYQAHIPQFCFRIYRNRDGDLDNANRIAFWSSIEARETIPYLYETAMKVCPDNYTVAQAAMAYAYLGDVFRAKKYIELAKDFVPASDVWEKASWEKSKARYRSLEAPLAEQPIVRPAWFPG